jgi:hypothetical protein
MAIVMTTGTLSNDTNTTGCQINLSGNADFRNSNQDTSTSCGTGLGLTLATAETYAFKFYHGDCNRIFHVATAAGSYGVMEVY